MTSQTYQSVEVIEMKCFAAVEELFIASGIITDLITLSKLSTLCSVQLYSNKLM
jgi:hypothetical protein